MSGHADKSVDFATNKNHSGNITIKTDTTVDKIIFSKRANETRSSGVVTQTSDGGSKTYYARKEIIISAGAFLSAQYPVLVLDFGHKEYFQFISQIASCIQLKLFFKSKREPSYTGTNIKNKSSLSRANKP